MKQRSTQSGCMVKQGGRARGGQGGAIMASHVTKSARFPRRDIGDPGPRLRLRYRPHSPPQRRAGTYTTEKPSAVPFGAPKPRFGRAKPCTLFHELASHHTLHSPPLRRAHHDALSHPFWHT